MSPLHWHCCTAHGSVEAVWSGIGYRDLLLITLLHLPTLGIRRHVDLCLVMLWLMLLVMVMLLVL